MNRVQPTPTADEPWVPEGAISSRGTHYVLRRADSIVYDAPLVVFVHGINFTFLYTTVYSLFMS
jgi:hypothetical protein